MLLVAVPAVFLALVALATLLGRWVWWLDVLANFRVHYFAILTVAGLVIVVSRWRNLGYAILGVALVNLVFVLPLYVGSPGEGDPGAPAMRVMSFNLLSSNENFSGVIEYIDTVDPDLVLLHEASRPWEAAIDSSELRYEMIRPRSDDLVFGTLVLVRQERVEAISHGFAADQPRAVELHYRPSGWPEPIQVLSTHPLAPTEARRAALRNAQIRFAAEWAESREGAVMVVGDLNATPWSWPFRLLTEAGLRNSQIGFGVQASFPATSIFLVRVPIDHLLHSEALVVRDRYLGPALGSDHFPLVVDIELRP
ncbi:MAG: endonuclease/exonuclease/phosphatase family protein [Actinobacteria bacterium]|nr:endonuclease/exonuclease/phosphatase family protein [Actinomycetota bacterium]